MLATSFSEGLGILLVLAGNGSPLAAVYFLPVLLALRAGLWMRYAGHVTLAPRARAALAAAGRLQVWAGTVAPLLLIGLAFWRPEWALVTILPAGVLAAASGLWCKFVIVRRAAYNQGFSLPHLPRRGAE
jgi:phenylacetyl-CoA:acceptor oxidoreductase subunit 2